MSKKKKKKVEGVTPKPIVPSKTQKVSSYHHWKERIHHILTFQSRSVCIFVFVIILLVFFITRFLGILSYPIFNDEAVYIQYVQGIHNDFAKFKFISMYNDWGDCKPPLQYWLGSLCYGMFGPHPLKSVRIVAILFSTLGLFSIFFFTKTLWGRREAVFSAVFYTLCPLVLFYSTQFIAEVFVFSTVLFFLWMGARIISKPFDKPPYGSVVFFTLAGTALLLFKQSGALYLYISVFTPLFFLSRIHRKENKDHSKKEKNTSQDQRSVWKRNALIFMMGILCSFLLYRLIIPRDLAALEDRFTGLWTFTVRELLKFPVDSWYSNFNLIKEVYTHHYTVWAFILMMIYFVLSFSYRQKKDILISFLFFVSSSLILLGLRRGFNEYIYNTAVIPFLLVALVRCINIIFFKKIIAKKKLLVPVQILIGILITLLLSNWAYQIILMKINPVKYLEGRTDWMKSTYLTSWTSGFGINEVVNILSEQKEPSIAFVDPQWGNPGTSLEVLRSFYPNVTIAKITKELLSSEFRQKINSLGFKKRFVIFSAKSLHQETRKEWQVPIESQLCKNRREIKGYKDQTPIIFCEF